MSNRFKNGTLVAGLWLALVAGGALLTAQATPAAAMRAYYEAVKAKDAAAFTRVLSAASQKMFDTPQVSVESVLAALARDLPATVPETRNEAITGEKATLEVRDVKQNRWEMMHFVREHGQWKLALDGKGKRE